VDSKSDEKQSEGGRGSAGWLLILPLVLILVPFFIVPIIGVVAASFVQSDGFVRHHSGLYVRELQGCLHFRAYLSAYWATLKFSVFAWLFSLLIGFWIAYFLVFHVRNPTGARAIPDLYGAVLDLEHHPHDFVDSAARQGGVDQQRADQDHVIDQPLDVLLFSSLAVVIAYVSSADDLHDRSDLQFDGAD